MGESQAVGKTPATAAEQLAGRFAEWCRGPGLKHPRTAEEHRRNLLHFLRAMPEVTTFAAVTTSTLDDYLMRLQLSGFTENTVHNRCQILRTFFRWAHSRGHLAGTNPATRDAWRIPPPRVQPLSTFEPTELEAMLRVRQRPVKHPRESDRFFQFRAARDAGNEERDRALLIVAYVGALHVGELAALTWPDLELDKHGAGTLRLRSTRGRDPEIVPLDRRSVAFLLAWRRRRATIGVEGDSMFGLVKEGAHRAFHRLWRTARITRGRRKMHFDMIRASAALHASAAGMADRDVQELLRHSTASSTERYLHRNSSAEKRRRRVRFLAWNAPRMTLGGLRE